MNEFRNNELCITLKYPDTFFFKQNSIKCQQMFPLFMKMCDKNFINQIELVTFSVEKV